MRIYSKFKDYYDCIAHQYLDKDDPVKYVRDERIYEDVAPFAPYNLIRYRYKTYKENGRWVEDRIDSILAAVLFCGEFHWLLRRQDGSFVWNCFFNDQNCGRFSYETTTNHTLRILSTTDCSKFLRKFNTPIVTITYDRNATSSIVRANANLSRVYNQNSFASAVHPWDAYQKLDMWIGMNLCTQPKMIELSDNDRIVKHGFDIKTSFRKERALKV